MAMWIPRPGDMHTALFRGNRCAAKCTSDWLSTRLTGQFAREHADLARSGIRKEHGPSCLA